MEVAVEVASEDEVLEVSGVEVESEVGGVEVATLGSPACAGRTTFTVRLAVPVRPFWSVALYSIVCVPE